MIPKTSTIVADTQRLCALLDNHEIDRVQFLEACTRLVTAELRCSRTGKWRFLDTARGRSLHCLGMYDGVNDRMTKVADEFGPRVCEYFLALEQTGYVMARDVHTHFATTGFFVDPLKPNRVYSLLAVSFAVNGEIYGAFTCTQVGHRVEWSLRQLTVLRQIGSRVSLSLAGASRTTLNTMPAPLLLS